MSKFERLEQDCIKAMEAYNIKDNLAFQAGYFKQTTKFLCMEIEQYEQEVCSLRAELLEVQKELT
jgi:hypothetical protein